MAKKERKVIKQVENAKLYSDGSILLMDVRASHPHCGTPYKGENDDGKETSKYSIVGMLPKKSHTAAKNLLKEVILKLCADNDAKVAKDKWFLRDGDEAEQTEYEGHFIVSANESKRPSVRDRDTSVLTPEEADERIVGGYWVNILIRPWFFSGKAKNGKTYPKRMCCGLVAVQFVRKDETFGEGRIDDDGVFDEVDGDDWNETESNDDDDL